MSIADLVRKMAEAGATPQVIALTVEAVEAVRAEAEVQIEYRRSRDRESAARRRLIIDVTESEWLNLRSRVMARDGFRCVYCGSNGDGAALHADHVIPLSRGGTSTMQNLATACRSCNSSKRDRTLEEWGRS